MTTQRITAQYGRYIEVEPYLEGSSVFLAVCADNAYAQLSVHLDTLQVKELRRALKQQLRELKGK